MMVVIVFGLFSLALLVVGAYTALWLYEDYKRMQRDASGNPIKELKRRFDLGELTREEFERELLERTVHPRIDPHERKAG